YEPPCSLERRAKEFGMAMSTLSNWENPAMAPALSYQDLERYQDLYGLPVCIFFCVAQMAETALNEINGIEKGKLEAIAWNMRVLADRVLGAGDGDDRDPLTSLALDPERPCATIFEDLIGTFRHHMPTREAK